MSNSKLNKEIRYKILVRHKTGTIKKLYIEIESPIKNKTSRDVRFVEI